MIKVIGIGKIKEKALQSMIDEYVKRLRAYTKIEVIEVADEPALEKFSDADNQKVMDIEGERVLKKIKDKEYVVLLDLHGIMMSSESFAQKMASIQTYQSSDITFVIGGSLGVSEALIKRSNLRLKLSDLTFTHQMVRLLVLEQIYRAYKINHNETYHK
ncbi:MAG: 23S rRNA (pseudouridine(1915)-N(3))-methyltransferase RlmH [Erysipelotrichia bacterium]|nr:23S rRNA (pseudouridine(1915)-N(3))-methyltransferase RlmH [Erysipelotrichia bacterium]NCC54051.1 23S rRNA (pseudouridine(1915)-N(3))-methyltransferase RlmH [Erysipelotrichia bacterium]